MKNSEKLSFINGDFTYDEAKEILIKMFNSKINFYKIKNWSSQERYGKEDSNALSKIPALNQELDRLQKLISLAKEKNKKLEVISEMRIQLMD